MLLCQSLEKTFFGRNLLSQPLNLANFLLLGIVYVPGAVREEPVQVDCGLHFQRDRAFARGQLFLRTLDVDSKELGDLDKACLLIVQGHLQGARHGRSHMIGANNDRVSAFFRAGIGGSVCLCSQDTLKGSASQDYGMAVSARTCR